MKLELFALRQQEAAFKALLEQVSGGALRAHRFLSAFCGCGMHACCCYCRNVEGARKEAARSRGCRPGISWGQGFAAFARCWCHAAAGKTTHAPCACLPATNAPPPQASSPATPTTCCCQRRRPHCCTARSPGPRRCRWGVCWGGPGAGAPPLPVCSSRASQKPQYVAGNPVAAACGHDAYKGPSITL